jgi:hypothetical protein
MSQTRVPALVFGGLNLLSAALIGVGVFLGLPARDGFVDTLSALVIALLLASGVGLLSRARWGRPMARVAASASLFLGLLLVGALAISASFLTGIYGPVGRGGAVILVLVAALAVPYLVVAPALQLAWLTRPSAKTRDEGASE